MNRTTIMSPETMETTPSFCASLPRVGPTTASSTMIIGLGPSVNNRLKNNIPSSLMIGFNSTKPTFFVGSSVGSNNTGKIGIGNITSPEAKLHILGDDNPSYPDEASLYIQSSGDYYSTIWLGDKDHSISTRPGEDFTFSTQTGNHFVFANGNVGIGTASPTELLEVNGNIKQAYGYKIETEKIQSYSRDGLKLYSAYGKGIFIDERGQVGINKTNPYATLDVNGRLRTASFQLPDPAPDGESKDIEGWIMQSRDRYGNASWVSQSSIDDGDWVKDGADIYRLNGKVGIGIPEPENELDVDGSINFTGQLFKEGQAFKAGKWEESGQNIYYTGGGVGIGTQNLDGYLLTVSGNIKAQEIEIQHPDQWYDFVFEEDYDLPGLNELESYVKQHKHLPDVPSEAELMEEGINLGEMNGILLKKIEELTLYVIQQQKEIDHLRQAISR